MFSFRKIMRSAQVYFPGLQDYRFSLQRGIRKFFRQTHDVDFEALSMLPISANNLFIDIGANRGDSIQSILTKRPEANVVAFEPNSYLTDKLHRLYDRDSRIKIINCGIGRHESALTLFIPFYNDYMFDGLASFREEFATEWLESRLYGFEPGKLEVRSVRCTVKGLDSFSFKPAFIKIDVQGFEYEVLMGAKRTIEECRPVLMIETPQQREKNFLSQLGYSRFYYDRRTLVAGNGKNCVNTFFIADENVPALKEKIPIV